MRSRTAKLVKPTRPSLPEDSVRSKPKYLHRLNERIVTTIDGKAVRFTVAEQIARAPGKEINPLEVLKTAKDTIIVYDEADDVSRYATFDTIETLKSSLRLTSDRERSVFEVLGGSVDEALPEV